MMVLVFKQRLSATSATAFARLERNLFLPLMSTENLVKTLYRIPLHISISSLFLSFSLFSLFLFFSLFFFFSLSLVFSSLSSLSLFSFLFSLFSFFFSFFLSLVFSLF